MIPTIISVLGGITNPRFYETERGYQGELLAGLRAGLPELGLPGGAVVEQEYQKRLPSHGIRVRPDIIVHVPALEGEDRRVGNFAVMELKLRAGAVEAREAFSSIDAVIRALDYPLGVFVNIDSSATHVREYHGESKDRLHLFAVRLVRGRVEIRHTYHLDKGAIEEKIWL